MSRTLKCSSTALAALLVGTLAACSGTNTTVTNQVPACSQSYPSGTCDAGSSCVSGACVVTSTLCSPTNKNGTCSAGTTCLSGGCVVTSDLCSTGNVVGICPAGNVCNAGTCASTTASCSSTNTSGTCSSGSTCFSGGCVTTSNLCSTTNTQGICASGQECFNGACVTDGSLCSSTNITGFCAQGSSCFGGGCVANSNLCSSTVPNGLCAVGQTCAQGACAATSSLCSSSNLTGSCAMGQTCTSGACVGTPIDPCTVQVYTAQPEIAVAKNASSTPAGILTVNGLNFKDLSKDGKLDAYEDWRLSDICRAKDLTAKLTLAQKIGLMTEVSNIGSGSIDGGVPINVASLITDTLIDGGTPQYVRQALDRVATSINGTPLTAALTATYMNNIQELSESQQWGIPFVVTADPVNGFAMNVYNTVVDGGTGTLADGGTGQINIMVSNMGMGAGSNSGGTGNGSLNGLISQWPQPLGIGAISDPVVAQQAGDAIRQDYRGLGLRWMLGPQADIATEPRWGRVQNTFGEDPYAVSSMVTPFMNGMQGQFGTEGGMKHGGIATTLKHFPGAGAEAGGLDSHSALGRYNVFPGNNFMQHVYPFRAAVAAGAAAVMPCYSIFKGQYTYDPLQVGAADSKELMTDLLRNTLGFNGLITSDWGVIGKAYGVENTSTVQRGALFIQAGSDQLGAESAAGNIQLAFQTGLITQAQLDNAIQKILEMSFKLGIFENPYTDYATVQNHTTTWTANVASVQSRTNGFNAQKMAMVILRNRDHLSNSISSTFQYLPIDGARKLTGTQAVDDTNNDGKIEVYFDGITKSITGNSTLAGTGPSDTLSDIFGDYDYTSAGNASSTPIVVADINTADIAIIRTVARKGSYSGLDASIPLSFDAPFPGLSNDNEGALAKLSRNKILDALRVRDGYQQWNAATSAYVAVAAKNPTLKIIVFMYMDRPAIIKPFVNGLVTLNDDNVNHGTVTAPDYYPLVSVDANINPLAANLSAGTAVTKGVDGFVVEYGAFDRAVLDFVFNLHKPTYVPNGGTVFHYGFARLPMEIPSTDAAVAAQFEDVPADSLYPTFPLGAGGSTGLIYTQ